MGLPAEYLNFLLKKIINLIFFFQEEALVMYI